MWTPRRVEQPARIAAALAFASAAISAYWTLGGTFLLDTVGGELEALARERSAAAVALGIATVALKVAAGVLALRLGRGRSGAPPSRPLVAANAVASAILCLWGGANVLVGALVLSDVVVPAGDVDRHALRWHVFVWDLWFLVWGLALGLAVAASLRTGSARRRARGSE